MELFERIRMQIKIVETETDHLRPFWSDEVVNYLNQKRNQFKQEGLWLPQIATEWGGLGLSLSEFGQVSEILGGCFYGHMCKAGKYQFQKRLNEIK